MVQAAEKSSDDVNQICFVWLLYC